MRSVLNVLARSRSIRLSPDNSILSRSEVRWKSSLGAVTAMPSAQKSGKVRAPTQQTDVNDWLRDIQSGKKISLDLKECNSMLRFWSDEGDVLKVERIIGAMRDQGVEPSVLCLVPVVFCYAKTGQIQKAEQVLHRMMDEQRSGFLRDMYSFRQCAMCVMLAYRREVFSNGETGNCVESAAAFFEKLEKRDTFDVKSYGRIVGTLMDIYIHAGQIDNAERIFSRLEKPDAVHYGALIKAFGNTGQPARAMDKLCQALDDPDVELIINEFTKVIDAWAKSSHPDAVDKSYTVLSLLDNDPRCHRLGVRPNVVVFGSILKSLAASKRDDAGKRAEALLHDMERRYSDGNKDTKPNVIAFNLALKACFQAGDLDRAESIMKRMEMSDSPPDTRTYHDILNQCAKLCTPIAAERAEQILTHIKELAKTNPAVAPDVYTYNIVMGACSRVGDLDRMWKVYELMSRDSIDPDMISCNTMITSLSQSQRREDIEKADSLLYAMEHDPQECMKPDNRHFVPLTNAWLRLGAMDCATRTLIKQCKVYIAHKNPKTSPIAITMDKVMRGWIKAGHLEQATALIGKMQGLYNDQLILEGPDLRSYRNLRNAWQTSDHVKKYARVKMLSATMSQVRTEKQQLR